MRDRSEKNIIYSTQEDETNYDYSDEEVNYDDSIINFFEPASVWPLTNEINKESCIQNIVRIMSDIDPTNRSSVENIKRKLSFLLAEAKEAKLTIQLSDPSGIGNLSLEDLAKEFHCYPLLADPISTLFADQKTKNHIQEIKIGLTHQLASPIIAALLDDFPLTTFIPDFGMPLDLYIKSQNFEAWLVNELIRICLLEYQVATSDDSLQDKKSIENYKQCIHKVLVTFPNVSLDSTLIPQIIDSECLAITDEIRKKFKINIDTYLSNTSSSSADHDFDEFCKAIFQKDNKKICFMLAEMFDLNRISLSKKMILTHVLLYGDLEQQLHLFLRHGLKPGIKNSDGDTAFHLFANSATSHCFGKRFLILKNRFGIHMNQYLNADDLTPCDVFLAKHKFLPPQCSDDYMKPNNSSTAKILSVVSPPQDLQADLIEAIQNFSLDVVNDLQLRGADLDKKDPELGATPREIANMLNFDLNPAITTSTTTTLSIMVNPPKLSNLSILAQNSSEKLQNYQPQKERATSETRYKPQ